MGIHVGQFRDLVIRPTLKAIGSPQDSEAAVQLLLATALHESKLEYLKQHPTGPALGVYQMEPATHEDHNKWLLTNSLSVRVDGAVGVEDYDNPWHERLIWDIAYATAMARVHYWRVPEALPALNDADGMWRYYKRYWNTHLGAATEDQFMAAWDRHEVELIA